MMFTVQLPLHVFLNAFPFVPFRIVCVWMWYHSVPRVASRRGKPSGVDPSLLSLPPQATVVALCNLEGFNLRVKIYCVLRES